MELPLFISDILYNSFKSIYKDCNANNFIQFFKIIYLGSLEERINLLFSILISLNSFDLKISTIEGLL